METHTLRTEMHNGASVSDWLGTAMTAARVSALYVEDVREGRATDTESALRRAADEAAQALEEITAVMDRLGYEHGYQS